MEKILIAENDPKTCDIIRQSLEPQGYDITCSQNGLEALGIIHNSPPFNLIILGANFSQMNSLGLLEIIRKRYPQTITLMISDAKNPKRALEFFKQGAYDTIEKPVKSDELAKTVKSALDEGRLMKDSGFIYKDTRREDRSLIRRGIFLGISDSLLVGLSFYIGFLLYLLGDINKTSFIQPAEILMMSLGFSFAYGFVFVYRRSHRTDLHWGKRDQAINLLWNISYAYILQLAILFLVKDAGFSAVRYAIGTGFLLGYLTLLGSRLAMPTVISKLGREGRKTITIIASPSTPDTKASDKIKNSHSDHRNNEPYLIDTLSPSQISVLMDRGKGRKINVVESENGAKNNGRPAQISR